MHSPYIQAGWTLAVLLGLYGFYCHWEAGRAELATAFRRRGAGGRAEPDARSYRARCRWALLGCSLLVAGAVVSAL